MEYPYSSDARTHHRAVLLVEETRNAVTKAWEAYIAARETDQADALMEEFITKRGQFMAICHGFVYTGAMGRDECQKEIDFARVPWPESELHELLGQRCGLLDF